VDSCLNVAGDIVWITGKFEQLPHIERKKRIDPLVLGETNQALADMYNTNCSDRCFEK
jgi:hypothetical protein